MKHIILTLAIFMLIGCKSSTNSSTQNNLENETIILMVHGLNSGSSTWENMVGKISHLFNIEANASVEIALTIDIKKNATCWDANNEDKLISCNKLSNITNQDFFRKPQVDERVFGLERGTFDVNSILWKDRSSNDESAKTEEKEKKNLFSKQRVFSINFTNNKQLSYDAQGYQLKKAIDDITKITGVTNYILIGHSMGGLASRAYIQNEQTKNIKKLITIDTPHLGGISFPSLNVGAGFYLGGENASVNLANNSKALAQLNDIDNIAGKYENIDVYHLGYSDGLNGIDLLDNLNILNNIGNYYDESDGIVDISSQMGPDSLDAYRVIFSPKIKGDIKAYDEDGNSADKIIESGDYGVVNLDSHFDLHDNFTMAHTQVLNDEAYIDYILSVIK